MLTVRYQSDFTLSAVKEKLSTEAQACEEQQLLHKILRLKPFKLRGISAQEGIFNASDNIFTNYI